MLDRAGQPSFLQQVGGHWAAMPMGSRFGVLALALAAAGLLGLVTLWVKRPDYRPLYSHLKAEDAAAVTRKLKELKVPYQLEDDGDTVLVPSAMLYQARLELAGAGLPEKGSVGFDLFDKTRIQTSALSERVTYVRALQGELMATIGSLDEVEAVRVHLALPTRDVFLDDQKSATASVVLKLRPGRRLTPAQVRSITALIAGSVENLTPEHVTVMDTSGNLLTPGEETAPLAAAGSLLELQQSQEKHLEERAQQLLDRVLGPGKGVVRVSLQLETDQKTIESHQFVPTDPEKAAGIVRSTQTTDEGYQSPAGAGSPSPVAAAPSPVPSGSPSPLPRPAPSSAGTKPPQYTHKVTTTNYEISQTEEKKVEHPGAIKRMSVAVVLAKDLNLAKPAVDDLTHLIEQATGADKNRSDAVTVAFLPFSKPEAPPDGTQMAKEEQIQQYLTWARAGVPVVAVVLFWIIGGIMTRRRSNAVAWPGPRVTPVPQAISSEPALPRSSMGPEMSIPEPRPVADMRGPASFAAPAPMAPPEEETVDPRLVALANVDATAQLIERWMQMEKEA